MRIDKTGKGWVGNEPADVREFLEAYASGGYRIDDFRLSKRECGSDRFFLWADDDEGCARRQCQSCERSRFICDSEKYWEEAKAEKWKCIECNSEVCNVGVGFSLYDDREIRWVSVGERCVPCGILGCVAGWKIGYSPSGQLLDFV